MITIYRKSCKSDPLLTRTETKNGDWIDVLAPSKKETQELIEKYHVPADFIHASLDERERPRIDRENGWRLIIVRIPVINEEDNTFSNMPLGFILNKSKFLTVYSQKNEVIRDFVINQIKPFCTAKKANFLLQIIKNSHHYFDSYMDVINKEIDDLEKKLLISQKNEEILHLLILQKTLVYFNTATVANGRVLDKMSKGLIVKIEAEADRDLLDDIIIENKELIETLSIFNNILSNTMDAYASIISNNLNIVMKFLTSFTIILSIPTIIFGLYGMNIRLPFQQYWWAIYLSIAISALIMIVIAKIFDRKNYL